jgi:xanthine/CO dehydrogenase XdhC/CoxF family maturation factor
MRKTLLLATILFLCAGVAQAQAVYEAFGNAVMAREGGAGEKAGAIVLFLRSGDHNGGIVTVRYSAPLAAETMAMVSTGTVATDVDEGTVTVTMPSSGTATVTISDVRLDLREATAPVTATFSGNENAFVSGVATVISAIEDALEVESTSVQILTRGGMGSATVTIKEAFASAFTAEADILLTLVGVPNKASLTVSHAGHPTEAALNLDPTLNDADVAGNVTLNADTTIVNNGDTNPDMLAMTGDGDKLNITVGFTDPNAASTESVTLMFDLDATSAQEDLMLPLDAGMVEVWVTMAPTKKPDEVDADTEYFAVNYIPADGVVAFTFAPASCTLLFPYAVVFSEDGWNTGIAISNPSAFGSNALSGAITFTLFMNGADPEMPPMTVTTGPMTGGAINDEGMLEAGNTYTVELSRLLAMAGHDGDFIGHLFAKTDFTGCRGVGWITDYGTVNQAYLPYFGDNLDEGGVPANQ